MPWGRTTHCDWVTTARVPGDFSHIQGQESHPQADTPTSVGPDLRQTLLRHRRGVPHGVVGLGLGTVWWENASLSLTAPVAPRSAHGARGTIPRTHTCRPTPSPGSPSGTGGRPDCTFTLPLWFFGASRAVLRTPRQKCTDCRTAIPSTTCCCVRRGHQNLPESMAWIPPHRGEAPRPSCQPQAQYFPKRILLSLVPVFPRAPITWGGIWASSWMAPSPQLTTCTLGATEAASIHLPLSPGPARACVSASGAPTSLTRPLEPSTGQKA